MRSLLVLVTCLGSIAALAQTNTQPPAVKGWDAVRGLSTGTALDIKLRKGSQKCAFRSADADSLACQPGTDVTIQRVDILTIKVHHRGRSALSGLAIGAGGAAIGGFAVATGPCNNFCFVGRGTVAAVFGVGGGAIGALTGYFTDFTRSVVYKAP
jgi:hypothetical protein